MAKENVRRFGDQVKLSRRVVPYERAGIPEEIYSFLFAPRRLSARL
jgi:hypothetical protein